jgi:outer membrane receptor protein involved in Fe transport
MNDLRRVEIQLPLNPGSLDKISYLPSANLIIKLKQDEQAPINLRLNFSQTVARPSIREVSSYSVYDNELKSNVIGNPSLKMVQINNYDLRFEAYFSSGDNISISAFRKDFKNHIEFFNYGSGPDGVGMRWQNSPFNSYLNGIEFEGKHCQPTGIESKCYTC